MMTHCVPPNTIARVGYSDDTFQHRAMRTEADGHLVERGRIKQLDNFDETVLHIFSRDVVRRIKDNDAWETMVPPEIAEVIKERRYFGYRGGEMPDPALRQ
jgi:hypothetical protein